jgi:hypothetical protein
MKEAEVDGGNTDEYPANELHVSAQSHQLFLIKCVFFQKNVCINTEPTKKKQLTH